MIPIDRGDPGGSNHGLEMFIGCILMELCMGISWAGPVPVPGGRPDQFEIGAWIVLGVYRPGSIGEFGCSRWSHSIEESEMVRTLVSKSVVSGCIFDESWAF